MLARTNIRRGVLKALLDNQSYTFADQIGLTFADHNVYDSPQQFNVDGSDACRKLPAIAIYTDNMRFDVSDDSQWQGLCFPESSLDLVIELWACAEESWGLEDVLDQFEQQVVNKLLPSKHFYPLVNIRGYSSSTARGDGLRRLGMRTLRIDLQFSESVQSISSDQFFCAKFDAQEAGGQRFVLDDPHLAVVPVSVSQAESDNC